MVVPREDDNNNDVEINWKFRYMYLQVTSQPYRPKHEFFFSLVSNRVSHPAFVTAAPWKTERRNCQCFGGQNGSIASRPASVLI